MSEASLAVQRLVYARLRAAPAVLDLVSAGNILDRNARPAPLPSIILGEDQVIGDDTDCGEQSEVLLTIHAFAREPGLQVVKTITGAVRTALRGLSGEADGHHVISFEFDDARFIRDPDGETSHAVLTFTSFVERAT